MALHPALRRCRKEAPVTLVRSDPLLASLTGEAAACPVCRYDDIRHFLHIESRSYHRCDRCMATWLNPSEQLSVEAEYAHYLNHENDIEDEGYQRFVAPLVEPLADRLQPGCEGLDFGCGPGPVGAAMLRQRGFTVTEYDPFFAPDPAALAHEYDFIFCCEVAEHFREPAKEFEKLDQLLKPGGWLGLMTFEQTDDSRFAKWHYRRDPTHVTFYRVQTLRYIATICDWSFVRGGTNVTLFQKKEK